MFEKITAETLSMNPFTKLGKDWALVTAVDPDTGKSNPMTVSWGGMGVLWGKNVVTVYIRPQRYTHTILDKTDSFTLSFYDMEQSGMREALSLCGKKSGRDMDKAEAAGLHPVPVQDGKFAWYEESELVFCCKILYSSAFDPEKIPADIDVSCYPGKDYHDVYIAEIVQVVKKKDE